LIVNLSIIIDWIPYLKHTSIRSDINADFIIRVIRVKNYNLKIHIYSQTHT